MRSITLVATLLFALTTGQVCSRPDQWRTQVPNIGHNLAASDGGQANEPACGYTSCPKTDPNKLNVHIVAHTHDDVGWLKTVDQYLYGTRKYFNRVAVENILDSVMPQLLMDKSKRFVYVEMSFFTKWWNQQEERVKSIVKQLVNEGRLEFINGGWCMNDEADVTYHSTIEQMTLGLKFLNETFGNCGHPKVGWQIDPFGHTNEQASLFAQFGFDGMYFSRIGYKDREQRASNKSLDLIWHGDRALPGQGGSIFTNVFRDTYETPLWCFDSLCQDDDIVDNKESYEYNVDRKAALLLKYIRDYGMDKMTNHVLIPFGGDFHFSAAGQNFKSMDRLIKFIRSNASDVNIFYSTPSCYQYAVYQAVKAAKNMSLPEKYNDFMPYDSSATVWWSGYFSSRPSVKLIERETAQLLQVSRQIALDYLLRKSRTQQDEWIKDVEEHHSKCLIPLWEMLGDLQHHDAVTGTEKQHVADDYIRRTADVYNMCAKMITTLRRQQLDEILRKTSKFEQLKQAAAKLQLDPIYLEDTMFCQSLNISQCEALESDVDPRKFIHSKVVNAKLVMQHNLNHAGLNLTKPISLPKELETQAVLMTIYNPLPRPISQVDVRLPCIGRCELDKVQVIHVATNETMRLTRLPVPAGIQKLDYRLSQTHYEMLFYANLPALSSASFVISDENTNEIVDEELPPEDAVVITDESLRQSKQNSIRGRRIQRHTKQNDFEYLSLKAESFDDNRRKRDAGSLSSQQGSSDRVVLKFDMRSGVITGLRRVSDGSTLNITQKFGQYFPANAGHNPGAYIFRPNTSEPYLLEKPLSFKMYKRLNGGLIEIHQKWTDWIYQTIRVDSKKNYIEFDYVVGPIPETFEVSGREIVTRYITNMANEGVFLTDSNARQLLPRHRMNKNKNIADETGGSFYPVVSTMMIRNNKASRSNATAEAVAILVDRAQGGTSLNEGDLEFLIHRRLFTDDQFGVGEALNEPGEDGRGLVTRGKHRLFLKFRDQPSGESNQGGSYRHPNNIQTMVKLPRTPHSNTTYEIKYTHQILGGELLEQDDSKPNYIVHHQLYNDIRQESIKYALRPIYTFDRLRVPASQFLEMLRGNKLPKTDYSLLNNSLPSNIHLLTLQSWNHNANQLLIRLENLDNPVTVHPLPDPKVYDSLVKAYKPSILADGDQSSEICSENVGRVTRVNIEYLLRSTRLTNIEELTLGANAKLSEDKRLDWTDEICTPVDDPATSSNIGLGPRQIRTFLVQYEHI